MSMKKTAFIAIVLGLTSFAINAQSNEQGEINGAGFIIIVPEDWNGGLVMYAHGYEETDEFLELAAESFEEEEEEEVSDGETEDEPEDEGDEQEFHEIFTDRGFAFAASEYRRKGLVVKEGIEDTETLRDYFVQKYGKPTRTIITGHSMGGMISLASIEEFPSEYDGAMPLCGWLGPVHSLLKSGLDLLVTFDYLFGENTGDLVQGAIVPYDKIEMDFRKNQKKYATRFGEHFRLKEEDIPEVVFFFQLAFKETTQLRGGLPAGNHLTIYDGFGFGDDKLNNSVKRYKADPVAQRHVIDYYSPKGEIFDPVFTLHTTYDELLPAESYAYYHETIEREGRASLYHQEYVVRDGHCFFSNEEVGSVFDRLIDWIENGQKPEVVYR